ncbi:MAG: hypothetical protein JWN50_384 [Parcubacteria group bacterium]|nr:hypothetical protein [Parcubacteria group bacterium]
MVPVIELNTWNGTREDGGEFLRLTLQILGRSFELKEFQRVYIVDAGGSYRRPYSETGRFIIYMYGRSGGEAGFQKIPKKMWGFQTGGEGGYRDERYLFEPSGDGLVIIDPDSKYAVAELIGNDLYILFPINDSYYLPQASRTGIYRKILEEARNMLGGGFPTIEELLLGQFIAPQRKVLLRLQEQIEPTQKELARYIAYAAGLTTKMQQLEANTPESDKIIERIARIPEVKSVSVRAKVMTILTHSMYGVDPVDGTLHEYGEFRLEVTFGDGGQVVFRNITRRVTLSDGRKYGHPHVDRDQGYWCHGEGKGVLTLLAQFEFEAAILFALKAIDSVNDSTEGNYLGVLREFPVVKNRMEYPKEPAPVNVETKQFFADIFKRTLGTIRVELEGNIAKTQQQVAEVRKHFLQGMLSKTLDKLVAAPDQPVQERKRRRRGKGTVAAPRSKVSLVLQAELEKIQRLPDVQRVSVEQDILRVYTGRLTCLDTVSGTGYEIGPFEVMFDFYTGDVFFRNIRPVQASDRNIYHAPHISGKTGELPIGQLTSTLSELLGGFELETAAMLALDFLRNFSGNEVSPEVLQTFRRAVY